jgi:hypothetical protein
MSREAIQSRAATLASELTELGFAAKTGSRDEGRTITVEAPITNAKRSATLRVEVIAPDYLRCCLHMGYEGEHSAPCDEPTADSVIQTLERVGHYYDGPWTAV